MILGGWGAPLLKPPLPFDRESELKKGPLQAARPPQGPYNKENTTEESMNVIDIMIGKNPNTVWCPMTRPVS